VLCRPQSLRVVRTPARKSRRCGSVVFRQQARRLLNDMPTYHTPSRQTSNPDSKKADSRPLVCALALKGTVIFQDLDGSPGYEGKEYLQCPPLLLLPDVV
jgi:hypothetical protein